MIIKSKDNQRFDLIFDDIGNILFKIKEKKVPWIETTNTTGHIKI